MPVQLFGTTTDSLNQWWLIWKPVKPSETQWKEWNQHFIFLDPIVNRAKTCTAHCKVMIFLDSSIPGVLDCAWICKPLYLCFQLRCILHSTSFHKGLFSHIAAPVSGARSVLSTPGGGISAVLCRFPSQVLKTVPWFMSLERVQPAPPNWQKGQGAETEQGHGLLHCPPAPGSSSTAASAVLGSAKAEEAPHILTKECACHREPRASIRIQLPELERPRHSHSPSVCHVGKWEKCNTSTWSIDRYWIGADAFPA